MICEVNPLLCAPRSAAERWMPCTFESEFRYQGVYYSNLGLVGKIGILVEVGKFCLVEDMSLYLVKGSKCRSLTV